MYINILWQTMFGQKTKPFRSVTSNGLTKFTSDGFTKWYKNSANKLGGKIGCKIEKEIEDQSQSNPKWIRTSTVLRCILGLNLDNITSIGRKIWHGQNQNMVNFYFWYIFDLECQSQSPFKTTGILTKLFCNSGSNFGILPWMVGELLCGQAHDRYTHTDTQTDAGDDHTPKAKTGLG